MPRKKIAALTLALALGLSSCAGGGDENEATESPTTSEASPTASDASPTTSQTSGPASESAATSTSATQGQATDLAETTFDTSWQDAVEIARDRASGDLSKIELEPDDSGRYAYKIELINDTEEYSVHIAADSGDVISEDTDELDSDEKGTERQEKRIDLEKVISLDEAMATARQEQSGAVNKWKLEGKTAGPRYEFDIDRDSGGDREIQVDALNGKILQDED